MDTKNLTTLELNQLIADKARESDEFRLALINDPKAAIKKEFEVEFPEDTKVEVHVESIKVLHLIIPAVNTDELTDDQLEDVAGGVMKKPGGMVCAYGVPFPGGGTGWKWPPIPPRR
ncbi:MAG: NHLP leader peptide family RiPP precursor [Syntrophomonadaceae bacterium]|nr:NHLP leader peptide family RiPP precursor [Syntrophomonadaceae bacterium]